MQFYVLRLSVKSIASAVIRCEVYRDLFKLLGHNVSLTMLIHTTKHYRTLVSGN
jgi:hypothetical protein